MSKVVVLEATQRVETGGPTGKQKGQQYVGFEKAKLS